MQLLHEYDAYGRHRIVMMRDDQPPVIGEWAAFTEIAILGQYRAATQYYLKYLPLGVFTVKGREHQLVRP